MNKVLSFWALGVHVPFQKYQGPPIVVRLQISHAKFYKIPHDAPALIHLIKYQCTETLILYLFYPFVSEKNTLQK